MAEDKKTLWDWLHLIGTLAVPILITVFGTVLTLRQDRVDRAIETQRSEQATLQTYLDQMGTLLLDRNLHDSNEDSDVRRVARARTLVVLDALQSSDRQRRVLRFLYETELIQTNPTKVDPSEVKPSEAKPSEAKPSNGPILSLSYASLRKLEFANTRLLEGAVLSRATLSGGDLAEANLERTNFSRAQLNGANLSGANLNHASLRSAALNNTDLSDADLIGADLSDGKGFWDRGARVSGADLDGANLSGANLSGVRGWTEEQLRAAESLRGATMPDGQTLRNSETPNRPTFEAWLKDKKSHGED